MRLRAFTAPTMSLAMARVRDSLGEDAIIVSTRNGDPDGGVTVMAALERSPLDTLIDSLDLVAGDPVQVIDEILHFHRTPPEVADPLRESATSLYAANSDLANPVALLAGSLDMGFSFHPLDLQMISGPIVLVGPPGSGKTIACAKIAAAAMLAGKPTRIITTDTARAGATDRLQALATRIALPLEEAPDCDSLSIRIAHVPGEVVVVDTPGVNPLDEDELSNLRDLLGEIVAPQLLVLPAGGDAFESAEQAVVFAGIGANGILASRLDASTRYGGLLAAAQAGHLPFVLSGIRPQIGGGLAPLNPVSLARLFAARHDGTPSPLDLPAAAL